MLYEDFFINKDEKNSVVSHITITNPITTPLYDPNMQRTYPMPKIEPYKITCSNTDISAAIKNEVEKLL